MTRLELELERELLYHQHLERFLTAAIDRLIARRARARTRCEEARKQLAGQALLFDDPPAPREDP